jgi:hypothetical protein
MRRGAALVALAVVRWLDLMRFGTQGCRPWFLRWLPEEYRHEEAAKKAALSKRA